MKFSLWFALRHLAIARKGGFLGRVSLLALLGVAIGVATLLTVFAFVQGFQHEVRELLTGMNPALFVSTMERGVISDDEALIDTLTGYDHVVAGAPFIQQNGVISLKGGRDLRLRGAILRGVDAGREPDVTSILASCDPPVAGFDFPGSHAIILGAKLAEDLGVLPGEKVVFTTVLDEEGKEIRHHEFTVIALSSLGLHEFDKRFAYADIETCSGFFRDGAGVDGIGLRLDDVLLADAVSAELRRDLDFTRFQVASWRDLNGDIFLWMSTMRVVLFLVLSLIILVAGFNIAGSMTIIVTEKSKEIGLLLSMGAGRPGVLLIFLLEGWLIGLAGVAAGGLFSLGLIGWFKNHPLSLPGEVYFIDHMPVMLSPSIFLQIAVAAFLVALFALIMPGLEALRRTPLDALHKGGRAGA
ncbi:MAG: FtsX-like permease family protein [bacterium]|nr:FtsX-like permease family protein [bacterium]